MKSRWTKWLKIALPGCVLMQFAAGCFGGDPTYFFSSTIANAIVYNLVSTFFTAIYTGLTGTTAMLLG